MKRIIANTGFVTNSSSQICWFDPKLLENPEVKAFMQAFGIEGGYVGENLWHRGECGSVLITKGQKEDANQQLESEEYGRHLGVIPHEPEIVTIYGDEYDGDIAYLLTRLLNRIQSGEEWGHGAIKSMEFN